MTKPTDVEIKPSKKNEPIVSRGRRVREVIGFTADIEAQIADLVVELVARMKYGQLGGQDPLWYPVDYGAPDPAPAFKVLGWLADARIEAWHHEAHILGSCKCEEPPVSLEMPPVDAGDREPERVGMSKA